MQGSMLLVRAGTNFSRQRTFLRPLLCEFVRCFGEDVASLSPINAKDLLLRLTTCGAAAQEACGILCRDGHIWSVLDQ